MAGENSKRVVEVVLYIYFFNEGDFFFAHRPPLRKGQEGIGNDDQVPAGRRARCGKPGLLMPPRAHALQLLTRLLRSRSFGARLV